MAPLPQTPDPTDIGRVQNVNIIPTMEQSFLDYAMSVIVARALPDVRDGLKPVHRRILYAMREMNLTHKSSYKKSARVVGEVLGKFHPHGDQAVYQALVRLAQTFSMRYPLVDGQGNFGSIDGDSAAAMRYTETRLAQISDTLLEDIDKKTVNFIDNFDGSQQEPTVLPSKLPNLLLMGSEGIAVGMATKIPPHNISEVISATIFLTEKVKVSLTNQVSDEKLETAKPEYLVGEIESSCEISDLLQYIKGPDFPTKGIIFDQKEIEQLYLTGKANIVTRGVAEITENKSGRMQILITELPYQVNKSRLISHIADLIKNKKIEGISDLRDESDRQGLTIAVDLKRDARPKSVLNNLYQHTELQTSFPANMVALTSAGSPRLLNLKQILLEFVRHRQIVIVRRCQFDLRLSRDRAHILEGLLKALDHIDEIIETIKKSRDTEDAKNNLVSKFMLSSLQAIAILDMQLRKLAALERQKLEEEYKQLVDKIENLILDLKNPERILNIIKDELVQINEQFGDKRLTKVVKGPVGEFSEEDLVPNEETIVTLTQSGYIKRMSPAAFRSQRRGGKGVSGMTVKDTDEIRLIANCRTHDLLMAFTNKGRVFSLKIWELPDGSRTSKGQAIVNLINLEADEIVQSLLTLANSDQRENGFLFFTTKKGVVKRSQLSKYSNIKSNGLIAIKLSQDDALVWVKKTSGADDCLLVTKYGKSIRFHESDVRPTDRDTMGVRGILLTKEDYVITMETFSQTNNTSEDKRKKIFRDLLIVTEKGMGKRTPLDQYGAQNRGGQGIKVCELSPKTGRVAGAMLVSENSEDLVITTNSAQAIKLPIRNIPVLQRPTQGVILMRLSKEDDSVVAITCTDKANDVKELSSLT